MLTTLNRRKFLLKKTTTKFLVELFHLVLLLLYLRVVLLVCRLLLPMLHEILQLYQFLQFHFDMSIKDYKPKQKIRISQKQKFFVVKILYSEYSQVNAMYVRLTDRNQDMWPSFYQHLLVMVAPELFPELYEENRRIFSDLNSADRNHDINKELYEDIWLIHYARTKKTFFKRKKKTRASKFTYRFGFGRVSVVEFSPSAPVCCSAVVSDVSFCAADSLTVDGCCCCSSVLLLTFVASSFGSKSGLIASCSSIHSSSAKQQKSNHVRLKFKSRTY